MIVCSCNVLTDHEIRRVIDLIQRGDSPTVVTPGQVFRLLDRRPNCGGCMASIVALIRAESEEQEHSRHGVEAEDHDKNGQRLKASSL